MIRDLTQLIKAEYNTIDIFGLILYSDSEANIKKVVNDKDYWRSFNSISGIRWGIYTIKLQKGHLELPDFDNDFMHFVTTLWVEPETNKEILKEFEIETTRDLPLFVIFTYDINENIISLKMRLDDTSIDAAYKSIKNSLSLITEPINRILPENLNNTFEIFQILRTQLTNHSEMELIKKGIKFLPWINKFIDPK